MPLPKPNPTETQDEFISRCMSDETMMIEYKRQEQSKEMILSKLTKTDKDLMANAALLSILGIVKKAMAKGPSEAAKQMSSDILELTYYINDLRMERETYEDTLAEINRKRLKAENEVTELIQNYDNTTQRGVLE